METSKEKMKKENEVEKIEQPEADVNEQRKSSRSAVFNPENRPLNTKGLPCTDQEMIDRKGGDKWGSDGLTSEGMKNLQRLIKEGKMKIKN